MQRQALCIGINDYPGVGRDLNGCVNDAMDWATILRERGYEVKCLFNDQATLNAMRGALTSLIADVARGDHLVVTFSGFGSFAPTPTDMARPAQPVWCPWDVASGEALPVSELGAMLDIRTKGARAVVISDTCHSGTVTRGDDQSMDPGTARMRILPPYTWMNSRSREPLGRMVEVGANVQVGDIYITACGPHQFAWEGPFTSRFNGAFTQYALKVLRQLPPDSSYSTWLKSLRVYLPSTRWPQVPQLFCTAALSKQAILG